MANQEVKVVEDVPAELLASSIVKLAEAAKRLESFRAESSGAAGAVESIDGRRPRAHHVRAERTDRLGAHLHQRPRLSAGRQEEALTKNGLSRVPQQDGPSPRGAR